MEKMTLTMNNQLDLKTDYSLQQFCKAVLKRRFPNELTKQEIYESDGDKINIACPYCGDSASDSHKKRGNLYLKTHTYKCYNDGCMVWVPLAKFISHFSTKYNLTLPGLEKKRVEFKPETTLKKRGFLIELLINREIGQKLLMFDDLVERFSLLPCSEADPESPVGRFVKKRKIDSLPVFESSCYYDSRQDKVYLFNLDLKSGRMLGFALRKLDDSMPGPKYNIKNYSELKKNGLVRDLEDSLIQEIDSLNNYFNVLNVDFSRPIIITEGQIDSMFLDNSIATTGVTKSKALLGNLVTKKNSRILFDNDKAGKQQSIELLKQGYQVFLWTKLISDLKKKYPQSARLLLDVKDINDLYLFLSIRDSSLTFVSFNSMLAQYFSDSAFDLILA
jgi:hypothetical protein